MNCSILIVDDSPILRAAIKKVAIVAGIDPERIHQAGDGQQALEVLDAQSIDLVLLDVNMPVMNGEQFVEAVNARPEFKDLAIVIVSTESNRERLDRMQELGVNETLRKPFEPEQLCEIIGRMLGVS